MKRPRSHQVGELAENFAVSQFLEEGWIVNRCQVDYGYDFLLHRLPTRTIPHLFAFLQVKGTESDLGSAEINGFKFRFDIDHLLFWRETPMPVYVAIVELPKRRMFVVNTAELTRALLETGRRPWQSQKSHTFVLPPETLFDGYREYCICEELATYWERMQQTWKTAMCGPVIGPQVYRLDATVCWAMQQVEGLQSIIAEHMGGREGLQDFLDQVGLPELVPPTH